ncbi:MAG: DUF4185 domain-containing protein [Anaerolineales bacterium]|nr:DUF4185 domain-containing protein [Anaerolineales bacterium]
MQNKHDQSRMPIRLLLILLSLAVVSCLSIGCIASRPAGRAFVEAERLFHQDPRWLGGDGALSIRLSDSRILWLFGDTFVATSNARMRSESKLVRNTVAIQTGKDPRIASVSFMWRQEPDGSPASFFPERGERFYWPGHGIRLDKGPLVIFLYTIVATPGKGLGFVPIGYALAVIENPDQPLQAWKPRIKDAKADTFDAVPATAVLQANGYVVALAIRQQGTHAGALVRYPVASLARGDVTTAEWWAGDARGWVPASMLGKGGPAMVLDDAGSECSIHWDLRTRTFIHVASYGFGATAIGLRTARALTGPWSAPVIVYRPPESGGPQPFVYAAKAHPELVGPEPADLVVTYATNSFEFADLLTKEGERTLYWPRFVTIRIGK